MMSLQGWQASGYDPIFWPNLHGHSVYGTIPESISYGS